MLGKEPIPDDEVARRKAGEEETAALPLTISAEDLAAFRTGDESFPRKLLLLHLPPKPRSRWDLYLATAGGRADLRRPVRPGGMHRFDPASKLARRKIKGSAQKSASDE